MGGTITLESDLGRGSTFRVQIPLTEAAAPPPETRTALPVALRPLKILLAEDDPINQLVAVALLEKLGHSVALVEDGTSVLKEATSERYDVILTDIEMPGMSGFEVARALREAEGNGRHTPIVALTAHTMKGDRERCLAAGMDGYASKPIDIDMLVNELAAVTRDA